MSMFRWLNDYDILLITEGSIPVSDGENARYFGGLPELARVPISAFRW